MPTKTVANYNAELAHLTHTRERARNVKLRAQGVEWDRWIEGWARRLLAAVGNRGRAKSESNAIIEDAAEKLQAGLKSLLKWSYDSAAQIMVDVVDEDIWVRRRITKSNIKAFAKLESLGFEDESEAAEFIEKYKPIINGTATGNLALKLIKEIEFPPPSRERLEEILNDTNAPDGLSAVDRIKTVAASDKKKLFDILTTPMTDDDPASWMQHVEKQITQIVDGGIGWKAKRIARTEGARIAEDGQREAWEQVSDMMGGARAWTAGDERVRPEHRKWHNKFYETQKDGTYQDKKGEVLPYFPAGPNCRCYTLPELLPELTDDLPEVDYGTSSDYLKLVDKPYWERPEDKEQ